MNQLLDSSSIKFGSKDLWIDRFHLLGTDIECALIGEFSRVHDLFKNIRKTIKQFDNRFSRFLKTSELSHLNAKSGRVVTVSDGMLELFKLSRAYWKETKGIFDPTVAHALIQAGYDVSFEHLGGQPQKTNQPAPRSTFGDCVIDEKNKTVFIPKYTLIDFGGIGKGFLIDQLHSIIKSITVDFCLSLGGDLLVSGQNQNHQPWRVRIQNPFELNNDQAQLELPVGIWGIATSGITKRKGTKNGVTWHHLIDPRTRKPSQSDVVAATVIAPLALQADVYAKTILLLGSKSGLLWIKERGCDALLVLKNGERQMTQRFGKYLL